MRLGDIKRNKSAPKDKEQALSYFSKSTVLREVESTHWYKNLGVGVAGRHQPEDANCQGNKAK